MRRLKYRLRPRGLIVACGLWGVLGCSTPDTVGLSLPPTKPDSNIANLPVHHDSAVVDTSGAVIAAGDAEVVIPQGALAEPVEIVVQTVQAAEAAGLQTFPEAENETILQFLPHGTQFLKPVTIQVPHHHEGSDDLVLYTSEPGELWAPVAGATFTDEFAKADVMHFSFFFTSPKPPPPSALVQPPPPPDPPPPPPLPVDTNNGGAGGAPSVEEAKGGSAGTPGAAGAGDTGNDPGPIVAPDAGVKEPPPDTDPGAGGAGNSGSDAGVAGGGGAPDHDPGGSPDAGPSTGGGGNDPPPMQLDYLVDGDWHGHLYSLADATSFVDRSGTCASGIVSADPQLQSFALWGWNLNQEQQGPVLSWDPSMELMHYDVMSSTPVRLSLRDADGKDWCYVLPDARGDVSFLDFNSACWNGSGDFYDGTTPLVSLNVVVPGDDDSDVPFDLCVKDLFPEHEPWAGDPGGGMGGTGGAGTGGAGGAGNTGGPDAGVPGGGGAPDHGGAGGGSAGSANGGTGGAGDPPPDADPDYLENADWRGYMFTASDPNSSVDRNGVCASGVVAIDAQSQSFAAWGWNLNQDRQGPALSWDPTQAMMHYELGSTAPVRLSLRDINGKDWCYALPEQQGDVSFLNFNSACWDDSGDFYDGTTPLVSLSVVVPGNDTTEVPFDLCVKDLFPEDEPFVPPPPPPPPPPLDYLDNGDWRGHMFSIADATSSVERVGQCAAGTITSNPQFQSFGGWGWNLNQQLASLPLSWDPTLPMMHYDVDSTVPLRLSLRDSDGKDWCYVLPEARGDVSFTEFNSACWDNSGDFYNGTTPLVSIGTVVPGSDTTDVDFQLCVNELYPELEAAPPPPPPPPPPPMQLDYRNIGDWQGHLYSVADAESSVERSGMCASGLVAANAQSYALWGWNLNQQRDEAALAWDPTLQSIHYFIGSSTALLLSLRDEQGRDWCYPIDTTMGDVLLTQFNSACWDFSGDSYDGTPLISINVVVPGNDIAPVDFNFCVSDLFPQDPDAIGGGGAGGAGGVGGAAGAGGMAGGAAGAGGVAGAMGGDGGSAGAPPPPPPPPVP